MKKTLTTLFAISALISMNAQTTFQNTTDLSGNEYGNMMQLFGGMLNITGTTDASAGAGYNVMIAQTDLLGNPVSNIHAGGTGAEYGTASFMSATGELTIAGRTNSFSTSPAGLNDVFLARLSSSGNPIFIDAIGTDSSDYASIVREANDGNIIIGGRVNSNVGGKLDGLVAKIDATTGAVIWSVNVGTPYANEVIYDVKSLGTNNGYLVAGYSGVNTIGLNEVWFALLDDNGALQGTFLFGGTGDDDGRIINDGPPGKFFISGNTRSFGSGQGDIFVARFDISNPLPALDWFKTYGGSGEDAVTSAIPTSAGGLVITGITTSFGSGGDGLAYEIDSNGAILWAKNYGGTGNDAFQNIISNGNGGYFVLGYSTAATDNYWLLEMDANGVTNCNESIAALLTTTANATLITPPTVPTGDFVSTPITLIDRNAASSIATGNNTAVFNSICLNTGITETDVVSGSVFPNPSNGIFNIDLGSDFASALDLQVYDATGALVYKSSLNASEENHAVDLSFLANGLYSVMLNYGTTVSLTKISILK